MSVLFTINFRRAAFLEEKARERRRVVTLGVWVAYFGALGVMMGLYGLNCSSLAQRAQVLERQTVMLTQTNANQVAPTLRGPELELVERYARSTRQWRDRVTRLGEVMPSNARLTSLTVNPQNQSDATSQNSLVIQGELRALPNQDRMQNVMNIVATLRRDSVFAAGYRNIKLASTKIDQGGLAEFVIECR